MGDRLPQILFYRMIPLSILNYLKIKKNYVKRKVFEIT
jgi:hypothetical protein